MNYLQSLLAYIQEHRDDTELEEYIEQARQHYEFLTTPRHGGSDPGKAPNKERDFARANNQFYKDYFSEEPLQTEAVFRRRYRMYRSVFLYIHDAVLAYNPWFETRQDATGKWGASSYLKVASAVRKLAYGSSHELWGEMFHLSESTSHNAHQYFCEAVVHLFKDSVIRLPNLEECDQISMDNAARGFPGCLGSIDCQHWYWAMCPTAHQGHYLGKPGKPTVVLEGACNRDLRFFHADFGFPGSINDLSIVSRSSFIARHIDGSFPPAGFSYMLNGVERENPYYLGDGIYPDWSLFLRAFKRPTSTKEKLFTKLQESMRKDIERAFGVMHKRWHVLATPSRMWSVHKMEKTMYTCIILHNLIIDSYNMNDLSREDNMAAELDATEAEIMAEYTLTQLATTESLEREESSTISLYRHLHDEQTGIMSPEAYFRQRNEVIEHIWAAHGESLEFASA
jgi:hypothetical protein